MFVTSSPTFARARSSARSRTMAAYSRTFAEVGVISMSSSRYCWVFSFQTPRTFIWLSTVTGSMVCPKENMEYMVSNMSRLAWT